MMTNKSAMVLTLVATALVALTCTCSAVDATAGESEDYTLDYKYYSKTLTATVIGYTGTASEIEVPATVEHDGNTYTVTAIDDYVFIERNFTKVTLNEGLEIIDASAFKQIGQKKLDNYAEIRCEVNIPSTVTKIGACAFVNFVGEITFADDSNVTSIGYRAFYNGDQGDAVVSNVNYGAAAKIDESNFVANGGLIGSGDPFTYEYDASDLTATVTGYTGTASEIEVPETVTHDGETYAVTAIGDLAFYECNFTKVTLPEGLETIEDGAFKYIGQKKLTGYTEIRCEVTIPSTVVTIGDNAFTGFVGQVSFADNSGIESIGYRAFYNGNHGVGSVTNINFADEPSIDESNFVAKGGLIGAAEYQAFVNKLAKESSSVPETATGTDITKGIELPEDVRQKPIETAKDAAPAEKPAEVEKAAPAEKPAEVKETTTVEKPAEVKETTTVEKAAIIEKVTPAEVEKATPAKPAPLFLDDDTPIVPLVDKREIIVDAKKEVPAETPMKTDEKKDDVSVGGVAMGSSLDGADLSGSMKIIGAILMIFGGLYVVKRQML